MVTLSRRITQLRDEKQIAARLLGQKLGFAPQAIEKFEAGKQTPTKEQLEKMADFFQVTVPYLKGETDDRTRMDSFMDWADVKEEPTAPPPKPAPKPEAALTNEFALAGAFFNTPSFQAQIRDMVRAELRGPACRDIIARIVKEEIQKQKK